MRSADTAGLVTGLAYFVADMPYQNYLSSSPLQNEVFINFEVCSMRILMQNHVDLDLFRARRC